MNIRERFGSRNRLHWKGKVYSSWAVSYVMVLLLPLLIWTVMQFYTNSIIDAMARRIYGHVLTRVMAGVETDLSRVSRVAMELTIDPVLKFSIADRQSPTNLYAWRMYEARKKLIIYNTRIQDLVEAFYVYSDARDYCMDSGLGCTAEMYYDILISQKLELTKDEWLALLRETKLPEYRLIPLKNSGQTLYYIAPVLQDSVNDPSASHTVLISGINLSVISQTIGQMDLLDGIGVEITLPNGQRMFMPDEKTAADRETIHISAKDDAGWAYRLSIPRQIYQNDTRNLRVFVPAVMAGTVLLGLFVMFILLRRNYDPLRAIIDQVAGKTNAPQIAGSVGEYEYLLGAFNAVIYENLQTRKIIDEQTERLRTAHMIQLLLDRTGTREQAGESLALLGFSTDNSALAVVVIHDMDEPEANVRRAAELAGIGGGDQCVFNGYGILLRGDAVFIVDCLDMSQEEFREEMQLVYRRLDKVKYLLADSGLCTNQGELVSAYDVAKKRLQTLHDDLLLNRDGEPVEDEKESEADRAMRASILAYVEENYADPNLSVGSICDFYKRSPSTIFRLFKEGGERGLLDNINQRRINRAKELIREKGNISLARIGDEVGFGSLNTFIRQFKKAEGITPGKFREITMSAEKTASLS